GLLACGHPFATVVPDSRPAWAPGNARLTRTYAEPGLGLSERQVRVTRRAGKDYTEIEEEGSARAAGQRVRQHIPLVGQRERALDVLRLECLAGLVDKALDSLEAVLLG